MDKLIQFSDELEALVAKTSPAVIGVEHDGGHGSGFVLTADGYVLTNHHVVEGAKALHVRHMGNGRVRADLVGSDPQTDLAVLSVASDQLVSLPLADPESVHVGQIVVAIGNPLRFERSISLGIVSAVDRSLPGRYGSFEGLIQTDAAINPGNSGGPLVNARGQVVGINTAVIPFAQGIGFAVPARTAAWVASVLLTQGRVPRRYLGIAARGELLTPSLVERVGQKRAVRVLGVAGESPASRAGIRGEDLVVSLDGRAIESVDDLQRQLVLNQEPSVVLQLWRQGKRHEVVARPDAKPLAA